jgi:hypothetical protein
MEENKGPEIYVRVGRIRVYVRRLSVPGGYQYHFRLGRLSPRLGTPRQAFAAYRHNLPEVAADIDEMLRAIQTGLVESNDGNMH